MLLLGLPPEILVNILERQDWKDQWSLLMTCRTVRNYAARILFRHISISCDPHFPYLNNRQLSWKGIVATLITWRSYIQCLDFHCYEQWIPPIMIHSLAQIPDLISICVTGPTIRYSMNDLLRKISTLSPLQNLKVECCRPCAWESDMIFFIRKLDLSGLACEPGRLLLPSCPKLEDLHLSFGGDDCCDDKLNQSPTIQINLSILPRLKSMKIRGFVPFEDSLKDCLVFQGESRSLQRLNIEYASDWEFSTFLRYMCSNLEEIRIAHSNPSNQAISQPISFPNLKVLNLVDSLKLAPLFLSGDPTPLSKLDIDVGFSDIWLSGDVSWVLPLFPNIPITLGLSEYDKDDMQSQQGALDNLQRKNLHKLVSVPNVILGDEKDTILRLLST